MLNKPFCAFVTSTILLAALQLNSSAASVASPRTDTQKTVTICAFTGKDADTVQVIRETLITDLARSGKITLFDAKNLPIGAKAPAGYRVVGSCSDVDGRVVLNIRTVNAQGQLVSGAAVSESGALESAAAMAHTVSAALEPRLIALVSPRVQAKQPAANSNTVKRAILTTKPSVAPHIPASLVSGVEITPPTETTRQASIIGESRPTAIKPDRASHSSDTTPSAKHVGYTSVIIDTRGLGLSRSMCPVIRRMDGSKFWTGGEAEPDFVISDGIVVYAHTMDEALEHKRAGSHPLMIKANARHNTPFPSDPLLADEDIETLMHAAERDGFLAKYRVVFVVDK